MAHYGLAYFNYGSRRTPYDMLQYLEFYNELPIDKL